MIAQKQRLGVSLSLMEKRAFPWRRNRIIPGKPVFFPGCNLVNFLPNTAHRIVTLAEQNGCGWLNDCCGKPLELSGYQKGAEAVNNRILKDLRNAEVPELIVACPNCLARLRKTLPIPVKDVYAFMHEKQISCASAGRAVSLFPPCPDRGKNELAQSISEWTASPVVPQTGLPCCGLGMKDPVKAQDAIQQLREQDSFLTPCCASCAGQFHGNGIPMAPHILTSGLGLDETPATGLSLGMNRIRPLFWK